MKYKGYTAKIEFDDAVSRLYGEVVGLRDAIMFEGESVEEIRNSFHTAVDDYLAFCQSRNEKPEKPYSGKISLRIERDLHRKAVVLAQREGKSLNGLIEWLLQRETDERKRDVRALPARGSSAATSDRGTARLVKPSKQPNPDKTAF